MYITNKKINKFSVITKPFSLIVLTKDKYSLRKKNTLSFSKKKLSRYMMQSFIKYSLILQQTVNNYSDLERVDRFNLLRHSTYFERIIPVLSRLVSPVPID